MTKADVDKLCDKLERTDKNCRAHHTSDEKQYQLLKAILLQLITMHEERCG